MSEHKEPDDHISSDLSRKAEEFKSLGRRDFLIQEAVMQLLEIRLAEGESDAAELIVRQLLIDLGAARIAKQISTLSSSLIGARMLPTNGN